MNKILKYNAAIAMALTLLITACTTTQPQTKKTLYERLGGKEAITAVVKHLWGVVQKDDRINGYFANTKAEDFAPLLIDFLCEGSGGPCKYKGRDMRTAHTGMNITSDAFDALAEDIVISLDHFNVPEKEKNEVMTMLGGMKEDIINH